jgi:hypothetical protein
LAVVERLIPLADEIESPVSAKGNEEEIQFMGVMYQSGLKPWLKRLAFLRSIVEKMRAIHREVFFTANAVRSGRLFIYRRNYALSHRLRSQKVMAYTVDLPYLQDFHALTAWLDENSIYYEDSVFCIYVPPQQRLRELFGSILSVYPPNSGLKILKELKSPTEAKYLSRDVNPMTTRFSDRNSYRPLDYLRVANHMYDAGVGPRIYDLIEIQTPHNSLSAYIVQHVAGTTPTVKECTAFLNRLDQLMEDQLIPLESNWKEGWDFQCPDCHGNLIRDKDTGKLFYIDFQSFMMRDANKYILEIFNEIRQDVHFGNTHWIRGGNYLYQSIPGLLLGKRDVDFRWRLFKQTLEKQGVSIEGSIVFDIGCNAGMIIWSALTDGAAWAVGWDRPAVAAGARKLLLSLGMTRFDIFGQDISSETDFYSSLPENVTSSANGILFFLAMRKHIGFPEKIKNLPFKFIIYEDHEGEAMSNVKNYLRGIVDNWGLRIVDVGSYVDGDSTRERVVAILCRD